MGPNGLKISARYLNALLDSTRTAREEMAVYVAYGSLDLAQLRSRNGRKRASFSVSPRPAVFACWLLFRRRMFF